MRTKIGAILSPYGPSRGMMIGTYSDAIRNLKSRGYEIEARIENFISSDQTSASAEGDFLEWLEREADLILLLFPPAYEGLFDQLGKLSKKTKTVVIPLSPQCAKLGNVNPKYLKQIWDYQKYGGVENIENLLLYGLNLAGRIKEDVPQARELPFSGIYHPERETPFQSIEEYLAWRPLKGKTTVGILFHRSYWVEKSLAVHDFLIKELEKSGLNVIAVFNNKFEGESDDEAVKKFFIQGGKAIVDLAIIQASFFLKLKPVDRRGNIEQEKVSALKELNVPTLLMISTLQTKNEWKNNPDGLTIPQLIIYVTLPEFDGIAEPIIIGSAETDIDSTTGAKKQIPVPLTEQIRYIISRIKKWCQLREKPNSEKKIAIILLNSPCKSGVEASVGAGFGLDTLESTARILKRLKEDGYRVDWVPENGKELIDTIMEKKAISEFRWTTLSEIVKKGGAAGFVDLPVYKTWLDELPKDAREKVFKGWGNPFGSKGTKDLGEVEKLSLALYDDKITIPGILSGNIFIGIQPKRGCAGARCDGKVCKILHDPVIPPPHQYIAYYKWLERVFGADVMVHVGTHGNIELLPGKAAALSQSCFSQFLTGSMPHLYIYVVSNPMEGVIAKRRSYAVLIDYLHPVMSASGTYGALEELEEPLEEYKRARTTKDRGREKVLERIIAEKAKAAEFSKEPCEFTDFNEFSDYLHSKMAILKETMIRDGLHILGKVPEDGQLVDMITSILRFDQGNVPSIRRGILEMLGLDYDEVLTKPGEFSTPSVRTCSGRPARHLAGGACSTKAKQALPLLNTNSKLLSLCTEIAENIVRKIIEKKEISDEEIIHIVKEEIQSILKVDLLPANRERVGKPPTCRGDPCGRPKAACPNEGRETNPTPAEQLIVKIVRFGLGIIPRIEKTTDEIDNLMRGFNGEFIEPGASGALARGKVETLPTGRNFYSIDPWKIPTPAAWKVGTNLAHKFFERYIHEHGKYPETIGFIFRFFDTFRADGELLSQILYTLGVRPVWDGARVRKLEVIPLKELKRPRIDCTIQLSNMLRDGMPNAFEMVDEAVQMAAELNEAPEKNYVRKHTLKRMKELRKKENKEKAKRLSTFRIFTAQPGSYDYGVNTAVAASAWEEEKDLSDIFIDCCSYAYGKGVFGQPAKEEFKTNLKRITATYDKWDSDEYDILECCHIFGSGGGFTLAAKAESGKDVKAYFADTHDPDRPDIRDMKDELERVARTRLLNPKWIEGKKRHGYKGAAVISDRVYHIYGWQATTKLVEGWIFDEIAKTFVLDSEMREWFKKNNSWALESLSRRLLEAEKRELWDADPEVLEKLKNCYLEIESWIEESMGDTEGDFQGGNIDIIKLKK